MTSLRAALVTPLTGPLAPFGQACATGITLWAEHAALLPPPWTDVALDVRDTGSDVGASIRAALDTHPDVLFGPYGSSTMLAAARVTNRVVWNHSGATSRLSRPEFPQVINVLSPASTYFAGVLQAVRAFDPGAATVSLFHTTSGFGRDVATGAASTATNLKFKVQAIPFEPYHAASAASIVPYADILLVVGSFADELAVAPILLTRTWRAAAFVGAGVEEVLAPLGNQREGLLGPAQWIATAALEPDEGPSSDWFVTKYRDVAGVDPPYPAAQAFAAGLLCARCLRDSGRCEDTAQLAAARQLVCTTLYGAFRLDPLSGLQSGHQMLIVQWQQGVRRVVWPPEQTERPLLFPLTKWYAL
ncbi:MAG TPA: ABC transporter substrate-binding protein [Ktedonobacteraceae bacterium]|jgi:branched-chain amino acid transport system substrate-binding protein|nr:ABC transporter substrate-binding protein [Ktedonobacteraceae bacterium]